MTATGGPDIDGIPDLNTLDAESDFQTLHEIVAAAAKKLDPVAWDYLTGGSETETTLRRNRLALDSLALRPRVLRDVSEIDTSAEFFGKKTALPVFLCPVGSLASFNPDGPTAVASAAAAFGVPVYVSSAIRESMETVAAAGPEMKVFQLYTRGDAAWIDERVARAKSLGYAQLCVTVDSALGSRRERDIAKRFVKPWHEKGKIFNYTAAFTWNDLKRIRDKHGLPIIVKGISTPEDADIACQMGVAAVHVSNHGGRGLDHGLGTTEVLPEVLQAVAGRAKVMVDGGFSRGTDVVKAIALGADAVGIGRLYLYGLAADGMRGVVRVLQILQKEIYICLGLLGVTKIADLRPQHLSPARPVGLPQLHSAFPLLNLPPEQRR